MSDNFSDQNEQRRNEATTEENTEFNHQVVVKKSQTAALDALGVIKAIWSDPINGLEEALQTLGKIDHLMQESHYVLSSSFFVG